MEQVTSVEIGSQAVIELEIFLREKHKITMTRFKCTQGFEFDKLGPGHFLNRARQAKETNNQSNRATVASCVEKSSTALPDDDLDSGQVCAFKNVTVSTNSGCRPIALLVQPSVPSL